MKILSSGEISHILISIVFFSVFLFLFFFTFAKFIEERIILKQIEIVANDFIDDFKNMDIPLDKLKLAISKITLPDISEEDQKVKIKNKKLLIKALIFNGLIALLGGIGVFYLWKKDGINIKEILRKNFIVLIFVFIIEVLFLVIIARNFISVDPYVLKARIIENIRNLGY